MLSNFEQIIIIGGTGQIGHRLVESICKESGFKGTLIATSRDVNDGLPSGPLAGTVVDKFKGQKIKWHALDLEWSFEKVLESLSQIQKNLDAGKNTALVVAAAFTNVDGCETDPVKCKSVNETNTIAVLDWAKSRYNAKLVFYSTDYVFDGEAGPYSEEEKRRAICVYGQSKVSVEEWIEKNAPQSLILRTTGVFDYIPGSKNFVMQMKELLGGNKRVRIPKDQFSNPVWALEIAKATLELMELGQKGIFNVAGGSWHARTEFTQIIASVFGLDASLIDGITTAELAQKAKRPLRGGLKMEKLEKVLGWAPLPAEKALKTIKEKYNVT